MNEHLLLLGHGSHLDTNSSSPVHALADELSRDSRFGSVAVAFWKEEPAFSRALDRYARGETVIAVPIFISNGYFVQEVLPRELGIASPAACTIAGHYTARDGIDLHYTPPIGDHPRLAEVIALRALEAGAHPRDAVAVLGHGTPRNPSSERNIFAQAERVRAKGAFAEVTTVFMDQEPSMGRVFDLVTAETVVMVPLFVAEGWHVGQTIPEELALGGGEVRKGGRRLRYAKPVGTHPSVASVVLELAAEALV